MSDADSILPGAIDWNRFITPELEEVAAELSVALDEFHSMASPHEGWAVIREEVDELWEHVKANTGRTPAARREAVQIAAMAIRYMLDLTEDIDPGGE